MVEDVEAAELRNKGVEGGPEEDFSNNRMKDPLTGDVIISTNKTKAEVNRLPPSGADTRRRV